MVKQMRLFFFAALLMIVAATVNAQVTTSAMAGHVADKQGEDIISALVRVVHKPSGTTYNAVTNVDGRWAIQGMRVGGPYEVKITYVGFADSVIEDITLQLGETYNLNVTMTEDVTEMPRCFSISIQSDFASQKSCVCTVSHITKSACPTAAKKRLSPHSAAPQSTPPTPFPRQPEAKV